jgi:hypothetical protein
MAYQFNSFEKRLNRIGRTHRQMANGFTPIIGPDGLIAIRPRRRRPQFPVRGVLILALGFLTFKAIMLAHFGMDGYVERVSALNSGTVLEQAGAWVMQPDQATVWIAGHLNSIIR